MPRDALSARTARRLFPSLADLPFLRINLDATFIEWREAHPDRFVPGGPNPVKDPAVSAEMVEEAHGAASAAWSFGGYLEDRRHLLKGSYLDASGNYLHLGVDFNVPEGTPVISGIPSTVMLVDDDEDQDGGWGPRVFLRPGDGGRDGIVAIFAHLRNPRCQPGDRLAPDEPFAEVGGPPFNGNWHPHLHLQLIRPDHFEEILRERFAELDGYGSPVMRRHLASQFPDPLRHWM